MSGRALVLRCAAALGLLSIANVARAWEPFRSESGAVSRGNQELGKGQAKEALAAYDEAARALPADPGVQLDRGLALLALGKLGEAREALRRAGSGGGPKELRAAALYDLGLAFMKEAELAAKAEDLDGAKKQLEEAVDAFKGSLRAHPNQRDAAWNLELAKRRLKDVQQKREEKQKKDEEQKKQKRDDQNQDSKQPKPDGQDGGAQAPQPDAGAPERGDAGQPNENDGTGEPDAGAPPQPEAKSSESDAGSQTPEPTPQTPSQPPNALPEHMERALDALESNEHNLEKYRARQRARAQPRRIEKDW